MSRIFPASALLVSLAVLSIAIVAQTSLAGSATFTVTRGDDPAANGCTVSDCSFREAVAAANLSGGTVEIPDGTDVVLTQGEVLVTGEVTIAGAGPNASSINGSDNGRVLNVSGEAHIEGVEITRGFIGSGCGGGIFNDGIATLDDVLIYFNGSAGQGGGVCNDGILTIENSTIDDNGARGDPAGGGVFNSGVLDIAHSTITGNTATSSSGGGDGAGLANTGVLTVMYTMIENNAATSSVCDECSSGAGIDNDGTLTLEWSTVRDNSGDNGAGLGNSGDATIRRTTFSGNEAGAIVNSAAGAMTISNSTISGNLAAPYPDSGVGGITNFGTLSLTNDTIANNTDLQFAVGGLFNGTTGSSDYKATIFSNNGQKNCNTAGSHASAGYNVFDDDTCATTGSDQTVADAMIGPLADNGGPTLSHMPLAGSPAINSGGPGCPTPDQRGALRAGGCDAGSVEFGSAAPTPSPTPSPTATPTPSPTPTPTPVGQTPTPTPAGTPPAGESVIWGDANCSGSADPIDSLLTLRFDAGLSTSTGDCPDLGQIVDVQNASLHPWGDVDCGGAVDPIDSLKLLRFDAGLSVAQAAGCPQPGVEVTILE